MKTWKEILTDRFGRDRGRWKDSHGRWRHHEDVEELFCWLAEPGPEYWEMAKAKAEELSLNWEEVMAAEMLDRYYDPNPVPMAPED